MGHPYPLHGHLLVHGFAHVIDGQQCYLHGGKGFHLNARGAYGFDGGGAGHAVRAVVRCVAQLEGDGNFCQCQGMAQGDQIAGFFGCLYACNAGYTQHIPFSGGTFANNVQRIRVHMDAALGDGRAMAGYFGADVHHVRLALCVKVG